MKNLQIKYIQHLDLVTDVETGIVIFETDFDFGTESGLNFLNPGLLDLVVTLWNEVGTTDCLGSSGKLDEYLMNSPLCTQEQREYIVEALFDYYHSDEKHGEFAQFEEWINGLPVQTLTDELKREILEEAVRLIDM